MTTLVFRTPGLIDMRALTMFGMSAKPNSTNPIGAFGTGLKYSLAVMVRLGAEPVLWRGDDRYTFFRKPVDFRGADFDLIGVRHERFYSLANPSEELPFTTQLGSTWEAWQAYRELEANTRDEGGDTLTTEHPVEEIRGVVGETFIIVDHPAMLDAHARRGEIFLGEMDDGDASVNFIRRTSKHVYYRGMRAYDLRKPALVTWNLQDRHELTEDRTLKYEFMIRSAVAEFVTRCDDEALVDLVLGAPETTWEHDLDFSYAGTPSDAFRAVMARRAGRVTESASRYYASHVAAPEPAELDVFDRYQRPWYARPNGQVLDALDHEVLQIGNDVDDPDLQETLLATVVRAVNEAER